ncbi:DNA repair exonuclease SbcCD nuclease subunit [Terribacillus halophilus]|uniref:DNA repair exonuclease SbcCD nuclease subunit n=1 Tax=Terribacillus halophilus TaxID=361279 RepID=A0A1G6P9G7_9BACI|nr:DNA repair exonuclease [Terribacillus halophilus]SDC76648.1 DNA repair exonuclease SbcCD nuclease subunit [Terribacillus halophilus]
MQTKITFIHAADLHLDSQMEGLTAAHPTMKSRLQESTFQSLKKLVQSAIDNKVDFILLAGDIFDSNRQSLKALVALREACRELQKHRIEVYIQYGNHDFTGKQPIMSYPDNVHIFKTEKVETFLYKKNGEPAAAIHGFSYTTRHIKSRKVQDYKAKGAGIYQIGMLHGSIATGGAADIYAPFSIDELKRAGFDYWALGHIHKRETLSEQPPIVYPGNIQGRHRKETGEKGCYLVELMGQSCSLTFVPLQDLRFEEVAFDIEEGSALYEVEKTLMDLCHKWEKAFGAAVLHVTFQGLAHQLIGWEQEDRLEELLDIVNEQQHSLGSQLVLASYSVQSSLEVKPEQLVARSDFTAALLTAAYHPDEMRKSLDELMRNRQFRKIKQSYSDVELQEMLEEAKQLLLLSLLEVE